MRRRPPKRAKRSNQSMFEQSTSGVPFSKRSLQEHMKTVMFLQALFVFSLKQPLEKKATFLPTMYHLAWSIRLYSVGVSYHLCEQPCTITEHA